MTSATSNLNSAATEAQLRRRQSARALDYVGTMSVDDVDEPANADELVSYFTELITLQRQTKREEFLKTLRTQMLEDKVRSGGHYSTGGGLLGDGL